MGCPDTLCHKMSEEFQILNFIAWKHPLSIVVKHKQFFVDINLQAIVIAQWKQVWQWVCVFEVSELSLNSFFVQQMTGIFLRASPTST